MASRTYIHPYLSTYIRNVLSALRHHPQLSTRLLTNRCNSSVVADWVRVWRAISVPHWPEHGDQGVDAEVEKELEVRPEHVREIIPSLVVHRLELSQKELSWHGKSDIAYVERRRRSQTVDSLVASVLESI
jgi:hypothetical protein